MKNLKVKVNNEAESKEAQGLFFKLGLRWYSSNKKDFLHTNKPYLCTENGKYICFGEKISNFDDCYGEEITLQELRDMVVLKRESLNDKIATAEVARQEEKHSHYKKDVSHLNVIDPYRIADLYGLHPCAEHIMKKSLCAGNRGHKDTLRDIQDIIDTAERWKQMIEEDSNEI